MIAEVSVARLFLNGFFPGVVIAIVQAHKRAYPTGTPFSIRTILGTFRAAIWGLLTPLIILGGIFSGVFTPSEAAVVAVNYALVVSLCIYRDMTPRDVYRIMIKSVITTAVVMFVISTSAVLSWTLANWNIPTIVANAVLGVARNPYLVMFLITTVIIITGVFLETASALIILTPVFLPLIDRLGIDSIHFGLVIVLLLVVFVPMLTGASG